MLRPLLAISVALALTACGPSTPSLPKTEPIVLPELPANLRTCEKLRSIASRVGEKDDLAINELRVLWAQDRTAAAQCFRRQAALVSFYEDLRARLLNPET